MRPDELGARLVALLGASTEAGGVSEAGAACEASVSGGAEHARATVDVPSGRWIEAVRLARDDEALRCTYFDWLSAVDELDAGFVVVAHLWSVPLRHGVLVRARLPRENPRIGSLSDLFPGASWHERETCEMFGVVFEGHPNLAPLLLPPEFEGRPLRKDFVLASRVAKPWPGAKEPGEGHATTARGRRAPMRPPGVPDPQEWGPQAQPQPDPVDPAAPADPAAEDGAG